ncbi:E3 ubiquitin-protein ligase BRE1-like 1 isoform X1 [Durio zibethinus]|uniref:E3 ubiquitin protein ligase n=1 Tax=Durio zibethinus TaxID=66656 RepID=A0A6P5ZX00_DURZI|nr:E3 ubiquitin-protein ligase BRE1-like 1 isoform X1 [Durio zibethinus]XP_022756961.1 E3 ubiquitin-protein ligase BRE1-like 1 isoform X1 [Durio zibethinus]XP_022756962.1 E3 ubiquitin-protein ligase BRE1-like 1 isoform X1 [Durio zibethinus]
MGSTGEADRKRRHFSSISPTAVAAKKQPFSPISEEKKLDAAVLQYRNQKLLQKIEAQKVEYSSLENKFIQLKEKQKPYDSTLKVVNTSWEALITDLESHSIHIRESSRQDGGCAPNTEDGALSPTEDAFLRRLMETGATESSFSSNCPEQMKEDREQTASEKTRNILHNIVLAMNDLWCLKDGLYAAVEKELPNYGSCRQKASTELESKVKNLRLAIADIHLKHRSLARELQSHRDIDAKNKAELKRLKGELESAVVELQESNCKLATLKAERDAAKGAFFPVLNLGGKHVAGEKVKDKHRDLQEMESSLKELLGQASSRLTELKGLHEERIKILQQLSNLQNTLKSVKSISSSQVYLLVRDQLEKSKSEVFRYQDLFEKLQVEKDNLVWKEKELSIKNDIADIFRRSSAVSDFRASHLGAEIQRQIDERKRIEVKLEEASREPGRKEIIAEFKRLLSSFPEEMSSMQSQLGKYKEAAVDIHSLRADVQSLSSILDRKAKECENLSVRSADQFAEINKLQAMVQDLKDSDVELKLILEMYRREFTDSRDVLEARDSEYKAWTHVQSLKSCLDEQNLELRVKTANEAEAISQQRLAAAEAEIAELRQKLEASKRDKARLSDALKSKNEENEAYLSEIESIGQAYDDMQTQNQQLLQQITERDDYNIKLVLEGVRSKQLHDALTFEKHTMEKEIQQASASLEFYEMKAARIEDQLRVCSDQVHKLSEERFQYSVSLENTQKRLSDLRRSSHQARESLEDSQSKIEKSRVALVELQIELEREMFSKKRIEEELEVVRRKVLRLRAEIEGSSILERLQKELREYKEILKCGICLDRPKEVVITKCYHLFCNPCVQKITDSRHRKCPVCAASFGANDVKPVYI